MGRIIFSVVLLVLLTILIVMNLGPTTPVNLFGARFDKIPVVAVAMLSFVVGVIYSLFLYVGQYLHRSSRQRLAKRHRDVEERERKLAVAQNAQTAQGGQAAQSEQTAQSEQAAGTPSPDAPPVNPPSARSESGLRRFFKLFR